MSGFLISLRGDDLKHVMQFMSAEESRPLLQHVLVEKNGTMVATNGHCLMAIAPDQPTVLPRAVLIGFPHIKKSDIRESDVVEMQLPNDEPKSDTPVVATLKHEAAVRRYIVLMDGNASDYPNWRNALPAEDKWDVTAPVPSLNALYLSRFATDLVGRIKLISQGHPERAVRVVTSNSRHLGIVMPLRDLDEAHLPTYPETVKVAA